MGRKLREGAVPLLPGGDGSQLPPEKPAQPPHQIFGPCPLWPNGWMDHDATWYRGKPRPRRHCVRWGRPPQLPPPKRGTAPQFPVHVCCGLTAPWIKTPCGTEVDLGPRHIVLDGDPAPCQKGHSNPPPCFRPCLLWPLSPISATAELLFVLAMKWTLFPNLQWFFVTLLSLFRLIVAQN